MRHKTRNNEAGSEPALMSVEDERTRWRCSRSTVTRPMAQAGYAPLFLGNLRRYRRLDVLDFERKATT